MSGFSLASLNHCKEAVPKLQSALADFDRPGCVASVEPLRRFVAIGLAGVYNELGRRDDAAQVEKRYGLNDGELSSATTKPREGNAITRPSTGASAAGRVH